MKKIFFTIFAIASFSTIAYSQVGINIETPKATLDVVASPDDATKIDGVIAPRLTGEILQSKNPLYGDEQEGTIIYATTPSPEAGNPSDKTKNVDVPGYYYFDGEVWVKMMSKKPFRALTNIDVEIIDFNNFWDENKNFDYFEFTSSYDGNLAPSHIQMPSPLTFKNRIIYIRNIYEYPIHLDWDNGGVPVPWETNYIAQNIDHRDSAAFYSDGTRWVQLAGI